MVRVIMKSWLVSILLGIAASIFIYDQANWAYYKYRPVSDIFQATVQIPDYTQGEDPLVEYRNIKLESFQGTFVVEIRNLGNVTVCRGIPATPKGYEYSPEDVLPNDSRVTLNWFIDTDPKTKEASQCANNLAPGEYYAWTTWDIHQVGKPVRELTVTSNVFEVKDKNDESK